MTLLFAIVLGIVAFMPLVILVRRADKIRVEVEALDLLYGQALVPQEEFLKKRHELVNRSLCYLWKRSRSKRPETNARDVS